jgi:hypothetical protein
LVNTTEASTASLTIVVIGAALSMVAALMLLMVVYDIV